MSVVVMVAAGLSRIVPWSRRSEGPWVLVAMVALGVLALLAVPVVDAVRDLAGARADVRADRVRLAALLLSLVAVAITATIGAVRGDETGEVGIFLALVAVPAATAVLGADLLLAARTSPRDAPTAATSDAPGPA
ncbi:hypothetical protein [Cellulomonas soli]